MTEPFDVAEIGAAWDRFESDGAGSEKIDDTHPDYWANEWLTEALWNSPEQAWRVIEWVAENSRNHWSCVMLAAGPLEILIARHGQEFIERIEDKARTSARWRYLLTGVWPMGNSGSDIWQRVEKVRQGGLHIDRDPMPDP